MTSLTEVLFSHENVSPGNIISMANIYEHVSQCPLCKCSDRYPYLIGKTYEYLKCTNCDLVYQTPRKTKYDLHDQYIGNVTSREEMYTTAFEIDKKTFKERISKTAEILKIDIHGKKILDIGCNIGSFLDAARELGAIPIGVEPNPFAAKSCKERGFEVITDFFNKSVLKGREESFDLVHLGDITEHVTEPLKLIKEVSEFLKPGGSMLIIVPNIDSIIAKMFQIKPNEHILYFNEKSLNNLVKYAGLISIKSYITSRKRSYASFKYSSSFYSLRNKIILKLVTLLGLGEFVTDILKYIARDEILIIAKKD